MSRTLSTISVNALNAQETDKVFIILLEISHASLSVPLRIAGNSKDITSNSNVFVAYPFQITLPKEDEEEAPSIGIQIDNVDRVIISTLRGLTLLPTAKIQIIRADAPDVIEVEFTDFELKSVGYDSLVVNGTLTLEPFLFEPYPAEKFTPNDFPGLF